MASLASSKKMVSALSRPNPLMKRDCAEDDGKLSRALSAYGIEVSAETVAGNTVDGMMKAITIGRIFPSRVCYLIWFSMNSSLVYF